MTAVMIGLGDEESEQYDGVLKFLDMLLPSEKATEEKKKVLSEEFDITMTESIEGGIHEMCNLSKGVAEKGFRIGMEQGLQQGLEQGIQQERETGTLRSIQSLMETLQLTAEQAMEALKVEESQRDVYAEKLKAN